MKRMLSVTLLLILYAFCMNSTAKACSPIKRTFKELTEFYTSGEYIAVEGYFISKTMFRVTRSSSDSIEIGHDYSVSEYGPFGSFCQMFEMSTYVDADMFGEENARLLIAYKDRSKNAKIVTPIFWEEGVDISDSENILIRRYKNLPEDVVHKTSVSLEMVRKRLFENDTIPLVWEEYEDGDEYYNQVFQYVEVRPQFPGGEKEMFKFIAENLQMPVVAAETTIHGRVMIRVVITEDGSIQDIEILRGLSPELDEEAIRIIKSMPKWISGQHNGRPVKVFYTIPISIRA